MFSPFGDAADRGDLGSEALEGVGGDAGEAPFAAVDGDPQTREIGAEALDDVLQVAVLGDARPGRSSRRPRSGASMERLDFLLGKASVSLLPSRSKNLTPLYSGGCARRR